MNDQIMETDPLSNSIQQLLKLLNITEAKSSINLDSSNGANFMGELKQIEITGKASNDDMIKLNLFVKVAPKNSIRRSIYNIANAYQREIYIYENVLPQLIELQKKWTIKGPFRSIPKFYLSSNKPLDEIIILEDMNALGYVKYDHQATFDYDHALLVIKELGKFHALSFALREKNPKLFQEIASKMHCVEPMVEVSAAHVECVKQMMIEILKVFDGDHRVARDKLDDFKNNVGEIMEKVVSLDGIEEHAVIGHGDIWASNLLFKYEGSPTDVCMLDWQMAKLCSPAHDLSQFMFSCCDKQLRAQHYTELIEEYYKSFSSLLTQFGEDPTRLITYAVLQDHLKKYSAFGLYSAIKVVYLISICDQPDLSSLTCASDLFKKLMATKKDPSILNERIKEIILDYINYEYEL